jgi:hypothetical protein
LVFDQIADDVVASLRRWIRKQRPMLELIFVPSTRQRGQHRDGDNEAGENA